jgi:hypothetical protein
MNYKIFCDESNHLLNDKSNLMVNGAIMVPENKVQKYNKHIKYLRHKYNYHYELKWTKLFSNNFAFYQELIDFFMESDMRFKATLVLNKQSHKHQEYGYDHNDFYYIAFYYTLRDFINSDIFSNYKIYLDYKETRAGEKIKTLKKTLETNGLRTNNVEVYIINSKESQILQLCDLFIGAIGYRNRMDIPKTSQIKNRIIGYLLEKRLSLQFTSRDEVKFNLFKWDLAR